MLVASLLLSLGRLRRRQEPGREKRERRETQEREDEEKKENPVGTFRWAS